MAGFNNESVSEINLGIKGTSVSSSGVNYNVSDVNVENTDNNGGGTTSTLDFTELVSSDSVLNKSESGPSQEEMTLNFINDEIDRLNSEMERVGPDDPRYTAFKSERDALIQKRDEIEQAMNNSDEKHYEELKRKLDELNKEKEDLEDRIKGEEFQLQVLKDRYNAAYDDNERQQIREEMEHHIRELNEAESQKSKIELDILDVEKEIDSLNYNDNHSSPESPTNYNSDEIKRINYEIEKLDDERKKIMEENRHIMEDLAEERNLASYYENMIKNNDLDPESRSHVYNEMNKHKAAAEKISKELEMRDEKYNELTERIRELEQERDSLENNGITVSGGGGSSSASGGSTVSGGGGSSSSGGESTVSGGGGSSSSGGGSTVSGGGGSSSSGNSTVGSGGGHSSGNSTVGTSGGHSSGNGAVGSGGGGYSLD